MQRQEKAGGRIPETVKDSFEHYWQYAKLWRTWVVGIAVAAMFVLLHKDIGAEFSCRARIAVLFLVAGGLQVLLAWVNKTCAYYAYMKVEREEDVAMSDKPFSGWGKFWCSVSEQYAVDIVVDILSLIVAGVAFYYMVRDLCPSE